MSRASITGIHDLKAPQGWNSGIHTIEQQLMTFKRYHKEEDMLLGEAPSSDFDDLCRLKWGDRYLQTT